LLILRQGLPLALEDGEGCRVKGIAVLKAALEKLAGFALRRRGIHCGPFRGELRSALKAPIGIFW
jgi:hypothetical protein